PDRPGRRPSAAPVEGEAGGHAGRRGGAPPHAPRARPGDLGRGLPAGARPERVRATAPADYRRAEELKSQIDDRRAQQEGRKEARARAPEVTMEDIAEIVSRRTGIPVSQLTQEERDRLLKLEERLHERVVGQDEAVEAV